MNRFIRTEMLVGPEAMQRLEAASVVVCGLGAVGSYAVEALARAGIGRLRLVDHDRIEPSNLNRQLYALESTLGRAKVDVAAERVLDINPACRVEPWRAFVAADSVADMLSGSLDVVIDAIDSLNCKVALLEAAVRRGLFTVSSMGAATRLDPAAVRVADLADTNGCPLARFLRKRLRRRGVERGIRCIFSTEPVRRTPFSPAPPPAPGEDAGPSRGRPRRPLGSLSLITAWFGLYVAHETIAHLLDWPPGENPPRPNPPRPGLRIDRATTTA